MKKFRVSALALSLLIGSSSVSAAGNETLNFCSGGGMSGPIWCFIDGWFY
ncbi:hypothetical protein GO986_05805 [Deinococcus sp. HMF7620]|uniref:Uncharacterized protein n=1 Tax=Deinococcus arboris TaxID=2682977 RepID=A0A7C9HYN3_9DEIO|nr:hypothetical protein [Deinococcus arboris]MVN86275.1 hypothetical protein [Deinococcus arboris]